MIEASGLESSAVTAVVIDSNEEEAPPPACRYGYPCGLLYCCICTPFGCLNWLPVCLCLTGQRCLIAASLVDSEVRLAEKRRPRIQFDGGGFALCFGLGVSGYLQDTYDMEHCDVDVYGISIGNIAALSLLLRQTPEDVMARLHEYLDNFLSGTPCMGMCGGLDQLRQSLWEWLPANVHDIVGDRYHVIVNSFPGGGFHEVNHFESKDELVEAVVVSCFFPGFVWRPYCHAPFEAVPLAENPSCGGVCCNGCCCMMDGGFQNLITPLERVMDVVVRPLPLPGIAPFSIHEVEEVKDPSAREEGHRYVFPASLIPTGEAVWNGLKPLRTGSQTRADVEELVHKQLRAAREDAARHAVLRQTFQPWLKEASKQ